MRCLALVVVCLSACAGSSRKESTEPESGKLVRAYNALTVAACACEDAACARTVAAEADRLSGVPSTEEVVEIEKAKRVMNGCVGQLTRWEARAPVAQRGGAPELVEAYRWLADEVCRCKSVACVNYVQTKATDLAGKMSGTTPTEEDQKAIVRATERWADCAYAIAKEEADGGGTVDGHEAVQAYQELADAICACADLECVADAQGKAAELASRLSGFTPTAREAQAIAAAGEKMAKCVQDLSAAAPKKATPKKKKKGHRKH